MAISKSSLSGKLQTKLKALFGNPDGDSQYFVDYCDAVAEAIVEEIQENLTATVADGDLTLTADSGTLLDNPGNPCSGSEDNIAGTIPAGGFN